MPDAGALAAELEAIVAEDAPNDREGALVDAVRSVRVAAREWLLDRGATPAQAAASVADVDRKLARYGLDGTGLDWFCSVVTARVVAVGRLQFEIGAALPDGTPAWGVHVPEGGPLDPVDCDRSFADAPGLLRVLAPGHRADRWVCSSWMLDPGLAAALGPTANTVRFARRFTLLPSGPARGDGDVAKFVFASDADAARSMVPRNTLQRIVQERWAAGEQWEAPTGWATVAS